MTRRPINLARLSPLRRGFVLGYRRAYARARKDLHALNTEVAALRTDVAAFVRDVHRYRAIEKTLDAERDFDARLN